MVTTLNTLLHPIIENTYDDKHVNITLSREQFQALQTLVTLGNQKLADSHCLLPTHLSVYKSIHNHKLVAITYKLRKIGD